MSELFECIGYLIVSLVFTGGLVLFFREVKRFFLREEKSSKVKNELLERFVVAVEKLAEK